MLDVTRLRVLAAVAATGSVTAAARDLNYAQPSISHHLARLETETGARLTRRVGRGIVLTPEGELLAQRAREIIGRLEAADAELATRVGLRAGRLRVAAFQSAMSALVPAAASALRSRTPDLELSLVDYHPERSLQQLRDGEIDLAIVFRHDDHIPDDGLRYVQLLDDPEYLLSSQPGQSLADHHDSAWIAGCSSCRRQLVEVCESAGFTPHVAYTSEDIVIDQALVAAGLGVTTMTGLALRSYRAPGVYPSPIDGFRRRISVALLGEPPDPPLTTSFIDALRATVGNLRCDTETGTSLARC